MAGAELAFMPLPLQKKLISLWMRDGGGQSKHSGEVGLILGWGVQGGVWEVGSEMDVCEETR